MPSRVRDLGLWSLVILVIAMMPHSVARASSESDKREIMALNHRLVTALNHAAVPGFMACYTDDPDAVFFEDTIPLEMNKAALEKAMTDFYKAVHDFHAAIESVQVVTEGNLAAVHYITRATWTEQGVKHSQTSRYTQVDRRENGKWLIWHEHFSVPFDPASGKAVFDAKR